VWSEVWEALVARLVWRRCLCEVWKVQIERERRVIKEERREKSEEERKRDD
jgi:hypothetical protein